jgi:uncharacterized membrane protein
LRRGGTEQREGAQLAVSTLDRIPLAASIFALGVLGLVAGDFVAVWQPVPKGVPARESLAWFCAIVCLATGLALPWPRTTLRAARVLLAVLAGWMLLFRLPVLFKSPTVAVLYESWGECAVMVAAAWVLCAYDLRIARWFYGLALVAFGVAHFAYVRETAALVPAWIPAHSAWVYLTGCSYVAAGAAVLSGCGARLGATLAAVQMALFTILVWIPSVMLGHADVSQWSELLDSWVLTAGAVVLAKSYRNSPWLAARPLA